MIINQHNVLYSFSVDLEKEIEEEVEKKTKRKNKETGKMEVVTSKEKVTVKKEIPYTITIKKPNRSELEDGDMFYSIELNKLIKKGLMTKAMLAKQYGSNGGLWSEKEQKIYADLLYKYHQKQLDVQQFSILGDKGKLSGRQQEKLEISMKEMARIKKDLTEYEMMQNSLFDHTADNKARNRCIMWYILHLTYFQEGEDKDSPHEIMFEGDDFESKYESYEDKEENLDPLYSAIIDKVSSIITIWYVSGNQEKESLEDILEEMKKEAEENSEAEEVEELEEVS